MNGSDMRLPDHEEQIAPVTIFDGDGRVLRIVPALEFRRQRTVGAPSPTDSWRRQRSRATTVSANVVVAMVTAALVATPMSAHAQEAPLAPDRPIVYPAPASKDTLAEAQRRLKDFETEERKAQRRDDAAPSLSPRPDLGEDVTSGIQRGAIQNVQPR
jgi:hypothetical protein